MEDREILILLLLVFCFIGTVVVIEYIRCKSMMNDVTGFSFLI